MKMVSLLLAADSVSLDIGANVGTWTRFLGALCPKGKIYAFEPSPVTFNLLLSNCKGLANAQMLRMALSDAANQIGFSDDLSPDRRHLTCVGGSS